MSHFVLVDCNNFYASCERLFNPRLEGCPVIVLSNNDGCVVARSQEAKQLGIKMGEPFFKIKDICKQSGVSVHSSNYQLYGNLSQRVMSVLSGMAPDIEIYSIDEAFLTYPLIMPLEAIQTHCIEIRRLVKKWVGIPTSIGIAPTKTLAKVANDLAKKHRTLGVFNLSHPSIQQEVLQNFAVEDIWGVGRSGAAKLHALGIYTASEFREMEPAFVRRKMGVVGERMLWELRGISCLPLEEASPKKSISCSRSFGRVVTESADLAEALAAYVNNACLKLRQQKSCAKALYVYLEAVLDAQAGTRHHFSGAASFPIATNDTPQMITAAKHCLKTLFRKGLHYKKCGVVLMDLIPEAAVLPDLFLGPIDPKRQRLMHTIDSLNERFGKNTVFYAAAGINPKWKASCNQRSPYYTTSWKELPVALA